MSETRIYVEGGGDSKELHTRCREGVTRLLIKCGFAGRLPKVIPCGSRNSAFDDFQTAHRQGKQAFVGLLVDSEDPVKDVEQTWQHLKARDNWNCPSGARNDQVFLMTTCMETWIIADRASLSTYYNKLQTSALPPTNDMERRDRHEVQEMLIHATRACTNAYAKNKRSFAALASVNPETLNKVLPSFARMLRILNEKL